MEGLRPAVDAGAIVVIQHDDPGPPNQHPDEPTAWLDQPLPKQAN